MKKKKGLSLVVKLILMAVVPVLLTGAIVTVVGVNALTTGMRTEKLEDLTTLVESIRVSYDALDAGKADAALAASLFHYKELAIKALKII